MFGAGVGGVRVDLCGQRCQREAMRVAVSLFVADVEGEGAAALVFEEEGDAEFGEGEGA